ncbi:hypothetical protein AB0M29_31095 [Streptomyces sp. NPDC051976]|uniref:hypothetical protein n=1 Tax=Streptomyces sp. NPDC051976 TaxID=3154947 RepID=UPI003422DB71
MDTQLTALAVSGATTLVSLMATDSWAYARELAARILTHSNSGHTTLADLDHAQRQLVGSDAAHAHETASQLIGHWAAQLQHMLASDPVTSNEIRALLRAFEQLASTAPTSAVTVHNEVNGGVHNAPVVQAGRISGLTFHTHPQAPQSDTC